MQKRIVLVVCIGFLCNPFLSFSQDSIADAMSVREKTNIQFQEHFFKALSEKAINHYKNAIQNLEECNHLIPQNTAVLFEISKNYLSLNNIFEAAQYGELALATSPNNYWILEHLVTVHKTARDFKTAIEYQQKLIHIKPKKREQLIILHLQNNDLKSAKKLLNQLEKENVLTARLRRIKNRLDVKSLKKTTNTLHKNQGLTALEKAFTQQKSYAVLKKIFVLSEKENPSNLLKYSKIGLSLFPAQPLVYLVNGKALNSKKDYKKALESLENGIDFVIDDKKMESNFYLAMVISYKGLGNVKQARNYQKKATLLLATINKKK